MCVNRAVVPESKEKKNKRGGSYLPVVLKECIEVSSSAGVFASVATKDCCTICDGVVVLDLHVILQG